MAVYMLSLDDAEKNRAFAESLDAAHVILADPTRQTGKAYGVVALGGLYSRRWTFYIDPQGRVREIDKSVNVSTAGQDIARTLEALGFPKAESP